MHAQLVDDHRSRAKICRGQAVKAITGEAGTKIIIIASIRAGRGGGGESMSSGTAFGTGKPQMLHALIEK